MSNSIWKMPEETPKGFSFILEHHKAYDFDNHKVIAAYDVFETGGNPQNPFDENTIRWCYLDELLAQADKAERLQKAVDLLSKYLQLYMDDYANEFDADGIYNDEIERQKRIWNEIKQLTKESQ